MFGKSLLVSSGQPDLLLVPEKLASSSGNKFSDRLQTDLETGNLIDMNHAQVSDPSLDSLIKIFTDLYSTDRVHWRQKELFWSHSRQKFWTEDQLIKLEFDGPQELAIDGNRYVFASSIQL